MPPRRVPRRQQNSSGKSTKANNKKALMEQPVSEDEDEDEEGSTEKTQKTGQKARAAEIPWARNPNWTWRLIDYLEEHPEFRQKLFSDTTKQANAEGRKKQQAKDQKSVAHAVLASWVFDEGNEADENLREVYIADKSHYAKSVAGQLTRLKKRYQAYCKSLGATGAGLDPEEVQPGSQISNEIQRIQGEFEFWDRLHALWRELPNYNPIGVTSARPGTDHAEAAERLWSQKSTTSVQSGEGDESRDEGSGIEDMPEDVLGNGYSPDWKNWREESGDDESRPNGANDDSLVSPLKRSPRIAALKERKKELSSKGTPAARGSPSPKPRGHKGRRPAELELSSGKRPKPGTKVGAKYGAKPSAKPVGKPTGKRNVNEAFGDVELAETERLAARQQQSFDERMAKIELKKRKMELEHEAKEKDREREHQLRMAMMQHPSRSQAPAPALDPFTSSSAGRGAFEFDADLMGMMGGMGGQNPNGSFAFGHSGNASGSGAEGLFPANLS